METKTEKARGKAGIEEIIAIPDEIEAGLDSALHIKGPKGELSREFKTMIKIEIKGKQIILSAKKAKKREKKNLYTIAGHIGNMLIGVTKGFAYKLQICFLHFPSNVSIDKEKGFVIIKNFLGESKERKSKILQGVDVSIDKDIITVSSCDKEAAGQTAANLETATKISGRDQRIFQDGIFILEKPGEE